MCPDVLDETKSPSIPNVTLLSSTAVSGSELYLAFLWNQERVVQRAL